jgi:hypothetical protein
MEAPTGPPRSIATCTTCRAALAYDQCYCVECGSRRSSLPSQIAQVIGGIRERGGGVPIAGRLEPRTRPDAAGRHPHWYDAWAQAPRAAAAAVLSTLGFGAVVGSMVGGGIASPLQTLVMAVSPAGANSALVSGAGAQDDGSQSGQTITEQATITQPGSGGAGGLVGSGSSGSVTTGTTATTTPSNGNLPPIKHVFLITLSNHGFQQTFGHPRDDPYLGQTLIKQGLLIPNYYAVAGGELANEVAMVSGQGPTPKSVADCPIYTKIVPGQRGPKGQVRGDGCVYPKWAQTLAGELTQAKLTWKLYAQAAGPVPGTAARARAASAADLRTELCRPKLGSRAAMLTAQNPYAAWRNPFLYFDSIVGSTPCPKNDVPLSQLNHDLKRSDSTPTVSYIVADACDDGGDLACQPGGRSGLQAADAFLKSVVPQILSSPAYKADGMLAITFDQAPQSGAGADQSSCCDNPAYPNLPAAQSGAATTAPTAPTTGTGTLTTPTTTTPMTTTTPTRTSPTLGSGQTNPTGGGGQVGLLILSRYVQPGTQDVTDYFNHFSLLASIEDISGIKRLGYTKDFSLPIFGAAVFSQYRGPG